MTLKNLMVHLDQGQRTAHRLELAAALARRHEARLVGVFGQLAQAQQVGVVATWPPESYVEAAEASRALFEKSAAGLAHAEWRDINRGSDAEVIRLVTQIARYFDLAVLGQYDDRGKAYEPAELVHEVVLNCGRPVLILPYIWNFAPIGKRPLIAWNDTREASRALNDSLALIADCTEALVLSLAPNREDAEASCAEAVRHLGCHGIEATSEVFVLAEEEGVGAMDMLLNRASDRTADLLIMGAHSGSPFSARGSGTRHILRHMTVPVLMSS